MIKRKPSNHNLRNKQFQFIDTNPVSKDFFRVDLPEKFYIGKNNFTLKPTDNLLKGSQIQIDILDSAGNNIYYEITDIINENNARMIVVYIYPETSFGEIDILIAGTTKLNSSVLWRKQIFFSYRMTTDAPIFKTSPTIKISEKLYQTKELTSNRFVSVSSSNQRLSVQSSTKTTTPLFKLSDTYIEPLSILFNGNSTPTSSLDSNLFLESNSSSFAMNRNIIPVNTLAYGTVIVSSSFFSSSMVGGILEFNLSSYINTNYRSITESLPESVAQKTKFAKFTASIIDIIDDTRAKIYPNFEYKLIDGGKNYLSFDKLLNFDNFSCSYFTSEITGSSVHPSAYQSYLLTEITNLEPIAGYVEYIDVLYKPYNFIGEYIPLNSVKIEPKDLFVDKNNLQIVENDLQFKRYGLPNYPTDVLSNWTSSIVGNGISGSSFEYRDGTSNIGIIYLNHTKIHDSESFIKLYATSSYDFISTVNGEYTVSFDYEYVQTNDVTKPQLDVHISGSALQTIDGTLIGQITNPNGSKEFDFVTLSAKPIKLFFYIYGGEWKIKNLKIESRHKPGFNLNHFYFLTPIPFLHGKNTNSCIDELRFKFKYRNGMNYSNIETNINGLIFSGSQ